MSLAEKFDVKGSAWWELREFALPGRVLGVAVIGFVACVTPFIAGAIAVLAWMNADLVLLALSAPLPFFIVGVIARGHGWIYFLRCPHGDACWCPDDDEVTP